MAELKNVELERVKEGVSGLVASDPFLREWLEVVPRVRRFYEREARGTFSIPRAEAYVYKGGMLVRGKLAYVHEFLSKEGIRDKRIVDEEEGLLVQTEHVPNNLIEEGYHTCAFDSNSALVFMSIPYQLELARERTDQPKIDPDIIKAYAYETLWLFAAHEPFHVRPWNYNPHLPEDRAKLSQAIHGELGEPEVLTVKKVVQDVDADRLEALLAIVAQGWDADGLRAPSPFSKFARVRRTRVDNALDSLSQGLGTCLDMR